MTREQTRRHSDGTGWESEAGYSRAVRRGDHIAVSGTTAHGSDGNAIDGDTREQTDHALRQALEAVAALGGSADDVIRTRIYLTPEADWKQAAEAHRTRFGEIAPANTMVYVHSLIGEGFLVEVEVEAKVR